MPIGGDVFLDTLVPFFTKVIDDLTEMGLAFLMFKMKF